MLIVVIGILLMGVLIGALVGQSVNDFSQDLDIYKAKLKTQTTATLAWLSGLGIKVHGLALDQIFNPGAAMNLAASLLNGLGQCDHQRVPDSHDSDFHAAGSLQLSNQAQSHHGFR